MKQSCSIEALRVVGKPRYKRFSETVTNFIETGYDILGETINDLEGGTVTTIAGCPGDGKSTLVHSIALSAIDENKKVLIVDGEHRQEKLINDIYVKVIGYDDNLYEKVLLNKRYIKEPLPHIVEVLEKWHKDNLVIFSRHEAPEIESLETLFGMLEHYIITLGSELIILDNLAALISDSTDNLNLAQSLFMKRTTALARRTNTAFILVAHPNKTVQRGEEFEYYQIAGNSDIPNLSDNVIVIWREFDRAKEADGYMAVKKNKAYGTLGIAPLRYIQQTSSLAQIKNGHTKVKKIDIFMKGDQAKWEKTENSPF